VTQPFELKFDETGLKSVVSAWIMQQMTSEQREAAIAAALGYLLEQPKDKYGYGKGTSPLQQSFNLAIEQVMRQVVREMVETDPHIQAQVKQLLAETFSKWLSEYGNEHVRRNVVEAIVLNMYKND